MGQQSSDIDVGIELIYRAGLVPQAWSEFLTHFCTMIDGVYAGLQGHDLRANTNVGAIGERYAPEYIESYVEHYAALNPWISGLLTAPIGQAMPDEALASRETLLRSEYYADWLRKQEDISAGVGLVLHRDSERMFMFTANLRSKDREAVLPALQRAMQAFAPHMARAFEARRLVKCAAASSLLETLEAANSDDALFVIDGSSTILRMNDAAENMLRTGVVLRDRHGHLRLDEPAAAGAVQAALNRRGCPKPLPAPAILQNGKHPSPLILCAYPLRTQGGGDGTSWLEPETGPSVIVVIRDPSARRDPRLEPAAKAFGLTPAERRLAEALLAGMTPALHAESKGASPVTVRNQLRSLFRKTGTSGQVQLVLLLRDFFPTHGSNGS